MTHFTGPVPSFSGRDLTVRRTPEVFAAVLGGAVAAGLGFGILAALVLFLWITSPSDSGPQGALRTAAGLWLFAHGADLVRTDARTGGLVPVGMTPLLLAALPGWLVHRAAAHALAPDDDAPDAPPRARALGTLATTGCLLGGYLSVGAVVLLYARHCALRANAVSALLNVPLLAVAAAVCGAWSAGRLAALRPSPPVRRVLDRLALPPGGAGVAGAAALRAGAVLAGGGLLLAVGMLGWHAGPAFRSFTGLTGSVSGRFAVALLAVTLLPNAAVWAAAYALGPGFAMGAGDAVSPAGAFRYPAALPDFPLLAALPRGGPPSSAWPVLLVPVAAVGVAAVHLARSAADRRWTAGRTAVVVLLTAPVLGAGVAVAAAFAGGPMGVGALAVFGPDGLRTGAAAAGWTASLALPAVLAARWWLLRGRPAPAPETSAPDTSAPDTSEPDTSEPDTSEPDTSAPDTSAPDTSEPDTSEPAVRAASVPRAWTPPVARAEPEPRLGGVGKPEPSVPEPAGKAAPDGVPACRTAGEPGSGGKAAEEPASRA